MAKYGPAQLREVARLREQDQVYANQGGEGRAQHWDDALRLRDPPRMSGRWAR